MTFVSWLIAHVFLPMYAEWVKADFCYIDWPGSP